MQPSSSADRVGLFLHGGRVHRNSLNIRTLKPTSPSSPDAPGPHPPHPCSPPLPMRSQRLSETRGTSLTNGTLVGRLPCVGRDARGSPTRTARPVHCPRARNLPPTCSPVGGDSTLPSRSNPGGRAPLGLGSKSAAPAHRVSGPLWGTLRGGPRCPRRTATPGTPRPQTSRALSVSSPGR